MEARPAPPPPPPPPLKKNDQRRARTCDLLITYDIVKSDE